MADLKSFHVFVSYRVATDAALAERVTDKLQQKSVGTDSNCRFRCFLDKQNLKVGEEWKQGFLSGLRGSCLFMPLISKGALKPLKAKYMNPARADNLLLELEMALEMRKNNDIAIFPLFVGENINGTYSQFRAWGTEYADTPPEGCKRSPKSILKDIFELQGSFCNPAEIGDKIPSIAAHFGQSVWPLFRHRWGNKDNLGPERVQGCVQCGQEYRDSENGEGSCTFHIQGKWGRAYQCCSQADPAGCQRRRHVHEHHNNYPYARKSAWVSSILQYTNKREVWLSIEAENYSGSDISVSVGHTLGQKRELYVHAGSWYSEWFKVFTYDEFVLCSLSVHSGGGLEIGTRTREDGSFASASWRVDSQNHIVGIDMECRSPTSQETGKGHVLFQWVEGKDPVLGEAITTQSPNVEEMPLTKPHAVERRVVYRGRLLTEPAAGDVNKLAKDQFCAGSGSAALRLKTRDRVRVNDRVWEKMDSFLWPVGVINVSDEAIILTEAEGYWGTEGAELTEAAKMEVVVEGSPEQGAAGGFPVTVPPKGTLSLSVRLFAQDATHPGRWFDVAWVAREKPVALKLVIKDAMDREVAIARPFRNPRNVLKNARGEREELWCFVDEEDAFQRVACTVTLVEQRKPERGVDVRIPGRSYKYDRPALRQIVYEALRANLDAVSLPWDSRDGAFEGQAWVDRRARRVYALHIRGESKSGNRMVALFPIPDYAEPGGADAAGPVDPCEPVTALPVASTSGWTEISQEEKIAVVEVPVCDYQQYAPADAAVASAVAGPSAGGGGDAASAESAALLRDMSVKLDMILDKLNALELRVRSLER